MAFWDSQQQKRASNNGDEMSISTINLCDSRHLWSRFLLLYHPPRTFLSVRNWCKLGAIHQYSVLSVFNSSMLISFLKYGAPHCGLSSSRLLPLLSIWRGTINVTNTAAKRLICNNLLPALLLPVGNAENWTGFVYNSPTRHRAATWLTDFIWNTNFAKCKFNKCIWGLAPKAK